MLPRYFTDSWVKEIVAFDYDVVGGPIISGLMNRKLTRIGAKSSGKMHNRRVLSNLQEYGEPDGMCQDTDGGIWTCRWQAGKVMRLPESGEVDVIIDFPTAWHMTNCVFGGEINPRSN
jgi:sugar lactone lactonase YvrE